MREVRYVGRYRAVEIEVAPERWRAVKRGATISVPDSVAESLLTQDAWEDPAGPGDDVPVGTISDVLAWVDSDPARAAAALEAERAGKARKKLLDTLEQLVAGPPAGDVTDGATTGPTSEENTDG
jgi:hypothetical protein